MKFKYSNIESKIHYIEDCEYVSVHPNINAYRPDIDAFFKSYSDIILEWTKGLYAPFLFLQDIIKKLNNFSNNQSVILEYDGKSILNISTIKWRYYESFKEDLEKVGNIKFFIIYYVSNLHHLLEKMHEVGISDDECNEFCKTIDNIKAFCLMRSNSFNRCIICINGNIINKNDHATIETSLDHELNHYFKRCENDDVEDLSLTEKIEKIGEDIGYDLHNQFQRNDFINHILDKSEFVSMISNVCNILDFKLKEDDKYDWFISHSTVKFILSDEYKMLCTDLQNILLFSTICRIYSSKRWNMLKEKVKIQLNYKESFIHSLKSGILTFIERIKNR